eukprot:1039052-Pelagomonas_calceolata.AAC.2
MPIPSSTLINFLAPDALLRGLLSTLVTKIRHGLLLVNLLIPIDFFFFSSREVKLMKGIHGVSAQELSMVGRGNVCTPEYMCSGIDRLSPPSCCRGMSKTELRSVHSYLDINARVDSALATAPAPTM